MHYYTDVIMKHYFDFKGRATRQEFWMFMLINFFIVAFYLIIAEILYSETMYMLTPLYSLFIIIPSTAIHVRRLHDVGQSGWMLLLSFIPLVGIIVIIVFACLDSEPFVNKYGPNPKGDMSHHMPSGTTQANETTTNVYTKDVTRSKRFCAHCGKESTTGTYCVNCGNKL